MMASVVLMVGMGLCLGLWRQERALGAVSGQSRYIRWATGAMLVLGLAVRLILGYLEPGYTIDVNTFKSWSLTLAEGGFLGFYENAGFADYPPGYLYVLALLGKAALAWELPVMGSAFTLLLRLPSVLGDVVCAALLYRRFVIPQSIQRTSRPAPRQKPAARETMQDAGVDDIPAPGANSPGVGLVLAGLYLFSPAVVQNSSIWGQTEGYCSALLLVSLLLLERGGMLSGGVMYGLAAATKPQMLIFAPVYICMVLFWRGKRLRGVFGGLLAVLTTAALAVPFIGRFSLTWVLERYLSTMAYYDYYTVNACNFWCLLQKNWASMPTFQGQAIALTVLAPVLAAALCALLFWRAQNKRAMLYPGAVLLLYTMYTLGIKMHERYLLPVLVLLLAAYGVHRDKRLTGLFLVTSVQLYLNAAYVLALNNTFVDPYALPLIALSAVEVVSYLALVYVLFTLPGVQTPRPIAVLTTALEKYIPSLSPPKNAWQSAAGSCPQTDEPTHPKKRRTLLPPKKQPPSPQTEIPAHDNQTRITARELPVVALLTAMAAATVFFRLGEDTFPQRLWAPQAGELVVLEVQGEWNGVMVAPGLTVRDARPVTGGEVRMWTSEEAIEVTDWEWAGSLSNLSLYSWHDQTLPVAGRYLCLQAVTGTEVLCELAPVLLNETGAILQQPAVRVVYGQGGALVDERDLVAKYTSYENGMVFDEIYHGRTAYEHILGAEPFENTHPPLGKLLIGLGIRIWGMTPFGWRVLPALGGTLTVTVFYLLLRKLSFSPFYASAGTLLLTADFLRILQSRQSAVDSFVLLFTLLQYLFMAIFLQLDWDRCGLRKMVLPLFLGGLCFGLAAAVKWTGIFSAMGTAGMLLWGLAAYVTQKQKQHCSLSETLKRPGQILLTCLLTHGAVAFTVYFCTFLPSTLLPHNRSDLWGSFWVYQNHMLTYHYDGDFVHPFASPWYEWPFAYRSIWYFFQDLGQDIVSTIAAFGNPLLCWCSIGVVIWGLLGSKGGSWRESSWVTGVLGFASGYLPWTLVPRLTFPYHYLCAFPFLILMTLVILRRWDNTACVVHRPSRSSDDNDEIKIAARCLNKTRSIQQRKSTDGQIGQKNDSCAVRSSILVFGSLRQTLIGRRYTVILCLLSVSALVLFYPLLTGLPTKSAYIQWLEWLPYWIFLP